MREIFKAFIDFFSGLSSTSKFLLGIFCIYIVYTCTHLEERETPAFQTYPALLSEEELLAQPRLLAGIYTAYPSPTQQPLTDAPSGYTPFYISHYGRHGSRFQPNDSRYVDTRQRLREAQACGNLTTFGDSVLQRVERLCDYACGHGGMLTTVGAREQQGIARRLYERFPEVFARPGKIICQSSVSPRCKESMKNFISTLEAYAQAPTFIPESDASCMEFIAYDTPEMRRLAQDRDTWYRDYGQYALSHLCMGRLMDTLFVQPAGLDTLHTFADLYWLTAGMHCLDLDFDLDDVFTPRELLTAYRCVNYRMYITCGNSPLARAATDDSLSIPARSASSLLRHIVDHAALALTGETNVSANLRFGHDTNLLRLLALMGIHNAARAEADTARLWTAWQECTLSPMAANLQMVFYHTQTPNQPVLVKFLLNENETLLDAPIRPVAGPYYRWTDLVPYFESRIDPAETDSAGSTINIQ